MRKIQRSSIFVLVVCVCIFTSVFSASASIVQDNLSESDLLIQEQSITEYLTPQDISRINAEVAAQKQKADEDFIARRMEEAQNIQETTITLKANYPLTGRDASHGGWGAGNCDSYWETWTDDNRNGSIAELAGSKWAKGWCWIYFTPSTTKNYTIGVNYNLTGRIIGGNLTTKIRVLDTTNSSENEQQCFSATSGYFDETAKSHTKTFYLTSGRRYCITFQADTDATAVASATMSDFLTTEFDGTVRHIGFNYFSVN